MKQFASESLSHDPVHGYIAFTAKRGLPAGEVSEQQLIDHPWLQRLRQIHQLQTAWLVFPAAEHTRFQHVLGVMHLGSRAAGALYDSLALACDQVPSRAYVESLLRLAGLLHDVGHGPFGHFFDDEFLAQFGLNHETLGRTIIVNQLGDLIRGVRRNPSGSLLSDETLDPEQIAYLITRPAAGNEDVQPRWLALLRSLFSGIYTIDNMDFVLRDAYMSGYSIKAFDLERLLHYSFFTPSGLTLHPRGVSALASFVAVRAELFRTIYFHRTVRAIDITLRDLFAASKQFLFPGNPLDHLDLYSRFTEWSLLVDVARWRESDDSHKRELGMQWEAFLRRDIPWRMACERTVFYAMGDPERSSIFSNAKFVEQAIRGRLPAHVRHIPLRVDLARHVHRPGTRGPTAGQNFLFDAARGQTRPLTDSELMRQIPQSYRICRIYSRDRQFDAALAAALDGLIGSDVEDEKTNM